MYGNHEISNVSDERKQHWYLQYIYREEEHPLTLEGPSDSIFML